MESSLALRRWLIGHFALNLLLATPLLLFPEVFLGAIGWTTVDPTAARFGAAALLAFGTQSFVSREAGPATLRRLLDFNLLWSWSVIAALVIAIADSAPNPAWAFLAMFIAWSGVWFHFRARYESAPEEEDELSEALGNTGLGDSAEVPALKELGGTHASDRSAHPDAAENAKAAAELAAWEVKTDPPPLPAVKFIKPPQKAGTIIGLGESDDGGEITDSHVVESRPFEATASSAPDADALSPDDIAAMLAGNGDGGAEEAVEEESSVTTTIGLPVVNEDAASADDIAAMLAATHSPDEEAAPAEDELAAPASEDAASSDDIAAMLAASRGDESAEEARPTQATIRGRSSALPDEASPDDIAAMLAQQQEAPEAMDVVLDDVADDEASADDIAAMLAANRGG